MMPNRLVHEAIEANQIPELSNPTSIRREVDYGKNSRIDLLVQSHEKLCYVEVKNVTLVEEGIAFFPDAVTQRGKKHLEELVSMVKGGNRAIMFYLVQREDAGLFRPAKHIDPVYADTLKWARIQGVEILVYQAKVTPEEITLAKPLPYMI